IGFKSLKVLIDRSAGVSPPPDRNLYHSSRRGEAGRVSEHPAGAIDSISVRRGCRRAIWL
ncbi:MAG: hypothetical protein PVG19_07870, partial [Desulfobacterales bacterium]